MAIVGTPRIYHHKYKFVVELDGFSSSGFQKCSELSAEVGDVEYSEGGTLYPDVSPGRVKFTELTLSRGATSDIDMYRWYNQVISAAANSGLVDPAFRRNGHIVQLERDGAALRRWQLWSAYPKKFVAGE